MIVSLIALAGTAQAAQKYKVIKSGNNNSNSSSSMNYSSNYNSNADAGFKFEARPGLGTVSSTFAFGASLEGKYGFNVGHGQNIFAGLESGFYHSSQAYPGNQFVSIFANMIPIVATGSFEFPVSHKVKLSAGTSLGIALITAGASIDSTQLPGVTAPPSQTSTKFIWSVRPGMVLNDMFVAELPLGTVDGAFYFLPSIGARF